MSFLDKLFLSGVASALKTPTGQIDVSGNAPVVGYVMKVIDGASAGWLPEAGGGGGGAAEPQLVFGASATGVANNSYLVLGGACEFTLPDATLPENLGQLIEVAFYGPANTIKTLSLESPNIIIEMGGAFGSEVDNVPAATFGFRCIYDPDSNPAGFWLMHRYAPGSPSSLPALRSSEVGGVYPMGDLPAPYDTLTFDDGDVIQGKNGTGNLVRDRQGSYNVGDLVLFPFLSDVPGVYRVVRDNGGTDWAFKFVEGPDSVADPGGEQTYEVRYGDIWGGRDFRARPLFDPFYLPVRAALDVYPANGDVLATGTNTGTAYDNTNQIVTGKVNLLKTSVSYHDFTLVEPPDDYVIGERFAVKCVDFSGDIAFNVIVANLIEGIDGFVSGAASFTLQRGTYLEWQMMPDGIWHLVSWMPGNTGA